jgi:hypothetical protein
VVLNHSGAITPEDLPDPIFRYETELGGARGGSLEELEREHMVRVLAESATLEEASATLGISHHAMAQMQALPYRLAATRAQRPLVKT